MKKCQLHEYRRRIDSYHQERGISNRQIPNGLNTMTIGWATLGWCGKSLL